MVAKKGSTEALLASAKAQQSARRAQTQIDDDDLGSGKYAPTRTSTLSLKLLSPSPYQPRLKVNTPFVAELAETIRNAGLAVPVLVRPVGDGFEIIDGHTRVEAVTSLGWEEVPCIIRPLNDIDARKQVVAANVARRDYHDFELALVLQQFLADGVVEDKKSLESVVGVGRGTVYRVFKMLELPESIRNELTEDPSILGGNGATFMATLVAEAGEAVALEALDLIKEGMLKESNVLYWWRSKLSRDGTQSLSSSRITLAGKFKATMTTKPGKHGPVIKLTVTPDGAYDVATVTQRFWKMLEDEKRTLLLDGGDGSAPSAT